MAKKDSRAMENFKLGAATLISNDACVTMGRTRPWYSAIIAGLLSIIIAVLPICISQFTIRGSDILSAPTYDLDNALVHFQEDLNDRGTSMVINQQTKQMTVTNWNEMINDNDNQSYTLKNINDETYFQVWWTEKTGDELTDFMDFHLKDAEGNNLTHSYIVFFSKGFVLYKSKTASIGGQYDRLQLLTFDLKDFIDIDSYGNRHSVTFKEYTDTTYNQYFDDSVAAWKSFFNDCYETYKNESAWTWTGIMSAVYVGFLFLMGLMIFLMTRGKNNPYRIYTFWETQKIAYWAAPASALVGMLLGLLISSMAIMSFIFVLGIRVMWLSMKNLRPQA